ncbi:PLP-dependent aspartate aminotransferase family protein [Geobacter hydrogenophilus]|uniref:Cystathionine gamma-synthase n=1 Tax=Geobacter hydrogenophilus TaxID=40983 RepID=A0A9W6G367_9BACT|nr:PLP-dependent aspartate aminotransferase family protein [Geobacter hydrogenophilus]MBT0894386.1 PLP-dependent aspartate aminotransferase family protein [Geobacter hydrogenophilus]GLI39458.1 cystathionine gamma-synthase [Geobacter hydrogenophilus]
MHKPEHPIGIQTQAVHAGESPDPVTGASAPNIVMSTTFIAPPDASFSVEALDEETPFIYTRWGNPTVAQLELKLAVLEEAEGCVAFASGMAAISALLFHTLGAGDHLVMSDIAYAAASEMTNELLPRMGVRVTKVNMADLDELAAAITPATKLVYAETPCNPLLRLTDIAKVAEIAHGAGARLAVDSTFATPLATKPLALGADYVIHSLTKYLGGHGDAIGGALLGPADELAVLRKKVAIRTGGILSPFNAWLIMRGVATLPLRMRAHAEGASQVAQFLEAHPKVTRVIYPGLPSHPQHELAKQQMKNFSGMLTFQVKDGQAAARVLAEELRIIHYAVSLGHQRSLVFYLPTEDLLKTSFHLTPEQRASYREFAGEGIFRFSVGIEDSDDLCRDLDQALARVR